MSQVLILAADFIDRMSNPAYGALVNEDYGLRFGELLSSQEFGELLTREMASVKDSGALSAHGWLWMLGWARTRSAELDKDLLLKLAGQWSSVFMVALTIDVATRRSDWSSQSQSVHLREFPHSWLRKLMVHCVQESEDEDSSLGDANALQARNVLIALMQVGSELTLDAARSLLNYQWSGQRHLVNSFESFCDELDEETREAWITRVNPEGRSS